MAVLVIVPNMLNGLLDRSICLRLQSLTSLLQVGRRLAAVEAAELPLRPAVALGVLGLAAGLA
jgi:hypothetical protein